MSALYDRMFTDLVLPLKSMVTLTMLRGMLGAWNRLRNLIELPPTLLGPILGILESYTIYAIRREALSAGFQRLCPLF